MGWRVGFLIFLFFIGQRAYSDQCLSLFSSVRNALARLEPEGSFTQGTQLGNKAVLFDASDTAVAQLLVPKSSSAAYKSWNEVPEAEQREVIREYDLEEAVANFNIEFIHTTIDMIMLKMIELTGAQKGPALNTVNLTQKVDRLKYNKFLLTLLHNSLAVRLSLSLCETDRALLTRYNSKIYKCKRSIADINEDIEDLLSQGYTDGNDQVSSLRREIKEIEQELAQLEPLRKHIVEKIQRRREG